MGRLPDGTRDIRILEPAVGRSSFTRYGIRGSGEYVVAPSAKYHTPDKRTGAHSPKVRGERLVVCGKTLKIIGGTCARRAGHGYDCKSRADMDRRAEDRRSGVGRWP